MPAYDEETGRELSPAEAWHRVVVVGGFSASTFFHLLSFELGDGLYDVTDETREEYDAHVERVWDAIGYEKWAEENGIDPSAWTRGGGGKGDG